MVKTKELLTPFARCKAIELGGKKDIQPAPKIQFSTGVRMIPPDLHQTGLWDITYGKLILA
jgi:hypothetical protein